jgi:hypothetical protein
MCRFYDIIVERERWRYLEQQQPFSGNSKQHRRCERHHRGQYNNYLYTSYELPHNGFSGGECASCINRRFNERMCRQQRNADERERRRHMDQQ